MTLRGHLAMFDGTPFKSFLWRLLGVRIGKRVFDDGCFISDRTLVTIGDGCTFNLRTWISTHSQEDGGFKSDRITIGAGCTLGIHAPLSLRCCGAAASRVHWRLAVKRGS